MFSLNSSLSISLTSHKTKSIAIGENNSSYELIPSKCVLLIICLISILEEGTSWVLSSIEILALANTSALIDENLNPSISISNDSVDLSCRYSVSQSLLAASRSSSTILAPITSFSITFAKETNLIASEIEVLPPPFSAYSKRFTSFSPPPWRLLYKHKFFRDFIPLKFDIVILFTFRLS